MESFPYWWRPTASDSSLTRKPQVRSARYGDGYEARWGSGLNPDLRQWTLRFEGLWLTGIKPIDDFLTARGGREAFTWTPPVGAVGIFVCREWKLRYLDGLGPVHAALEGVFEEVATP